MLFQVQTDKVVMEEECPASGVVGGILAHEDETVPVAWVVGRPTIFLILSVEHRVLDGARGARLLQELRRLI